MSTSELNKFLHEIINRENIKTVLVIHELDEYTHIQRADLEFAEVPIHKSLSGKELNIYDVASFNSDAIIILDRPSKKISDKLLKQPGILANMKKVCVIKCSDDESPDYQQITDEMDAVLSKL